MFDSSTGFRLPDGSDLLVELARPSDQGPRGRSVLRAKLATYQANGAQLGWLLIPAEQAVEIWPAYGPAGGWKQLLGWRTASSFPSVTGSGGDLASVSRPAGVQASPRAA